MRRNHRRRLPLPREIQLYVVWTVDIFDPSERVRLTQTANVLRSTHSPRTLPVFYCTNSKGDAREMVVTTAGRMAEGLHYVDTIHEGRSEDFINLVSLHTLLVRLYRMHYGATAFTLVTDLPELLIRLLQMAGEQLHQDKSPNRIYHFCLVPPRAAGFMRSARPMKFRRITR